MSIKVVTWDPGICGFLGFCCRNQLVFHESNFLPLYLTCNKKNKSDCDISITINVQCSFERSFEEPFKWLQKNHNYLSHGSPFFHCNLTIILKQSLDCLRYTKKEMHSSSYPYFITAIKHGYRCFVSYQ